MSAVAIIPARGGSRRIPGKNKRLFHGKPIIAYSIETAKKSRLFGDVFVSTDDQEIAEIATRHGATPLLRPIEFCEDEIGTQEVMKYVLSTQIPHEIDHACCIYPTAPMMTIEDLWFANDILRASANTRYAVSVGAWLSDAGQFYFGRASAFIAEKPLLGPHTALIPIPLERVQDINTEDDWSRAEKMFESFIVNESFIKIGSAL